MEKKKNRKKKWRDVRNALVMTLLMVAMMSTATYAWFTMTSNPTVTGMQMVASSGTGLSVCNTVGGTYVNAIEIAQDVANMNSVDADGDGTVDDIETLLKLIPVSLSNNGGQPVGFCDPVRDTNGVVTGLSANPLASADLAGKVAVYTYYIKSEEGNQQVGIIMGSATQSGEAEVNSANQPSLAGTFVRQRNYGTDAADDSGNSVVEANGAVRVGIVVTSADSQGSYADPDLSTMIILEPNNDIDVAQGTDITSANVEQYVGQDKPGGGTYDGTEYTPTPVPNDLSASAAGVLAANHSTDTSTSVGLFTVSETPKKVTMYVWLEGTDKDCVDQIKTDELEAQIQFTGVADIADAAQSSNNLFDSPLN